MRNNLIETPGKNAFFRAHHEFRPIVSIVDIDVDTEKQFFAVADEMVQALAGIGITVTSGMLADEAWSAKAPIAMKRADSPLIALRSTIGTAATGGVAS